MHFKIKRASSGQKDDKHCARAEGQIGERQRRHHWGRRPRDTLMRTLYCQSVVLVKPMCSTRSCSREHMAPKIEYERLSG